MTVGQMNGFAARAALCNFLVQRYCFSSEKSAQHYRIEASVTTRKIAVKVFTAEPLFDNFDGEAIGAKFAEAA